MNEDEIELPLYPYVRTGKKRGPGSIKLSVMDSRSGEELAWWLEGADHSDHQKSRKHIKSDPDEPLNTLPQKNPLKAEDNNPFDPTSVFVKGLDVRTRREQIFAHFISLGDIERVTKLQSKSNGQFIGCAYVQFSNVSAAEEALFLNGSYLNGANILVQVSYQLFMISSLSNLQC